MGHTFTYPVIFLWDYLEQIRAGQFPGLVSTLRLLTQEKSLDVFIESNDLIKKLEPDPQKQAEQLAIAMALAGRYQLSAESIMEIIKEDYKMLKEKNTFFEFLRQEGMLEGERKGTQDSIMVILQERFGTLDAGIKVQVKQVHDDQVLKELLRTSLRAKNLNEFKETLSRRGTSV